jgi:hypothetical protein
VLLVGLVVDLDSVRAPASVASTKRGIGVGEEPAPVERLAQQVLLGPPCARGARISADSFVNEYTNIIRMQSNTFLAS